MLFLAASSPAVSRWPMRALQISLRAAVASIFTQAGSEDPVLNDWLEGVDRAVDTVVRDSLLPRRVGSAASVLRAVVDAEEASWHCRDASAVRNTDRSSPTPLRRMVVRRPSPTPTPPHPTRTPTVRAHTHTHARKHTPPLHCTVVVLTWRCGVNGSQDGNRRTTRVLRG